MRDAMDLSKEVWLPSNAVTQSFGIYGIRGSGKTYMAGKMAELMCGAGHQTVIVDPIGNWWGLRFSKSGKGNGIDIPIIGGLRGQAPLEPKVGKTIANFLADTRSSAILDVSQFSKGGRKQFVADLLEEVTRRQKRSPSPIHFFFEEAHLFAPQRGGAGDARMLGAIEDIVRLGRNWGIGSTLISQRPQSVNTEVRNQADPLIVMRLVAKHERRAIEDWMQHQGAEVEAAIRDLATLKEGYGYFWSPGFLNQFAKIRCHAKRTFDSTSTPTAETAAVAARDIKPVDLAALEKAMGESIERQKEFDPKHLKAKVRDLEKQLAEAQAKPVVDQSAIDAAVAAKHQEWIDAALEFVAHRRLDSQELEKVLKPPAKPAARPAAPPKSSRVDPPPNGEMDWLQPAHQRILDALAWLESFGCSEPSRANVAAIAGASPKSSAFGNNLSRLSSGLMVWYPAKGLVQLTLSGKAQANAPSSPATLQDLHNAWRQCRAFQPAHVRLLNAVIEHYPNSLTRSELAEAAGASVSSSAFGNNVSRLSSLGLIRYPGAGEVVATELLFPGGRA